MSVHVHMNINAVILVVKAGLRTGELQGRTIWIADAHRDDGKRFVVRADEILTAFVELEAALEPFSASSFL